jgi:hypothetical protein
MVNKHVCKKCNRELPEGFKKDICENCQNKRVDLLQKVGAGLLTVAGLIVTVLANNSKE